MKIVADENIPFAREAFGSLGEVSVVAGRSVDRASVADADILLVRSVTKVGPGLLEGSSVRFVATATIGTDHVDQAYLAGRGITFASAPGSNSNSVAEYIVAALLVMSERRGHPLEGTSIAVIGVGNVGSKVARYATVLGMQVMRNDPPLARESGDPCYRPLDEVIGCGVMTFHVPLTHGGEDRTFHLADGDLLGRISDGALFINSSRGAVMDTDAVVAALDAGRMSAVLDVWEGEPDISRDLLGRTDIATPHIAGYSFDGKVNATAAIYRAACACVGAEPSWKPEDDMPAPVVPAITVDCAGKGEEDTVREAVRAVYDIREDDRRLRQDPARFDLLRKEYPQRREFFNTTVALKNPSGGVRTKLEGLGFIVT